ncbi:GLPGLI family protein [Paenimyroides tangerinum]|uniref:GLPGLI family protein n=1 Tax=Paenimyroides tangerinum TaxID=2488728 RepID=A0A3P3VZ93_9FLAO|nr:GLPGLI family protein [Paenimyroides tangerinum]RRJ88030.1 GLPGLI family protein [Paenimyroides tangerinum]
MKILFLFLFCYSLNAQNLFHYEWYVKGNLRDGILFNISSENRAVYIDYLDSQRKFSEQKVDFELSLGEEATVIRASTGWYNRYFFKQEDNVSYIEDFLQTPFVINDSTFNIKWELVNETKLIEGFQCNLAKTEIRGRSWEVWYTSEIPIPYGPWKFYGLPGLIVLASESKDEFWFRLTKIESNPNFSIPKMDLSNHKSVTLEKYDNIQKEFTETNRADMSSRFNIEYSPSVRNGIEVIYEWEE